MTGTSYNGYSWPQRERIITAFRRVSGRSAPFEDKPCSICGDPARRPDEWHSEDYSEPFSFAPPQTYPVCSPCHGLHKRFNANPGEWALFRLHLEAGGYGAEFTKHLSLERRRLLAARLAAGSAVELPKIRERDHFDPWWRDLTLDPESLHAPWARPRPLRSRPDAAAFADAIDAVRLSSREAAMLRAHADAPRRTMSMRAIATVALASNSPGTANLLYGGLARRLAEVLEWRVDRRADGSPIWMSLIAEGWQPPAREFEWTIVPTAAAAARAKLAPS